MLKKKEPLVLYDGECGFCNRIVQFVLRHDKTSRVSFASIQSSSVKALFHENGWTAPDLSTFYFIDDGQLFQKSKAAFRLAKYLTIPYSWLRLFSFIPTRLADKVYDFVASKRKRFSKGFCVRLTEEEQKRFLT